MSHSGLPDLAHHFDRHLVRLADEIQAYPDEPSLWRLAPGILNSGGTLTLHIVGNLNHWIGANLGKNGYVRDREAEFADRDVPRSELLRRIEDTRRVVEAVLSAVPEEALGSLFPDLPDRYAGSTTSWFLGHLTIHLGYHLGQVNYHRRLTS
jgi:hypothetical protein